MGRRGGVKLRTALQATVEQLTTTGIVKHLDLHEIIGTGGYGTVYRGEWRGLQGAWHVRQRVCVRLCMRHAGMRHACVMRVFAI